MPESTSDSKAKAGQGLKAGAEAEAVEEHCLLACFSCILSLLPLICQDGPGSVVTQLTVGYALIKC